MKNLPMYCMVTVCPKSNCNPQFTNQNIDEVNSLKATASKSEYLLFVKQAGWVLKSKILGQNPT
jgi:hypothetical protein